MSLVGVLRFFDVLGGIVDFRRASFDNYRLILEKYKNRLWMEAWLLISKRE